MKWVAIIGGGLVGLGVLAVLVLAALGMRSGAGRIAGEEEIDRPPAEVWPWIVEGDRLEQWVGWLTEVYDLTPGTDGVGARRKWVMIDPTMNNRRVEIAGEVTAYDPERLSTMAIESPGMFSGTASYALTDLGAGRTRIEYTSEFRMQSWLGRLFEPLVTPQASRKAVDDLARLRQLIEAEPRAGL
jgi:uncharacterized protein YndB with AHSA1/START domain